MAGSGIPTRWRQAGVLAQIALRNLYAAKARSAIVGGIILMGAALVVLGGSLLDSVDSGMRRSIQGSLGGHVQVFDARSKDELALYGGMMGEPRLTPIADFAKVKEALSRVPGVKLVVPMGIDQAMIAAGNAFDIALEKLRADVRAGSLADPDRRAAHKAHVRRMVQVLDAELEKAQAISAQEGPHTSDRLRQRDERRKAMSQDFWSSFDNDPLGALEFLENRIAPQSLDGSWNYVRYVGTDIDAFFRAFDRAEVVGGMRVPPGQRGILLGKLYAEDNLKLRTARRLDKIRDAIHEQKRAIAGDEELQRWVRENTHELRDILLQLDPIQAASVTRRLQTALHSTETNVEELLIHLLTTDDSNFDERYQMFYTQVAPFLNLYSIKVGDTITIQAPGQSGYMKSVNVKVFGFVQFKGLEKSAIAGIMSVIDLVTFRDLYGYLTKEKAAEIEALKNEAGLRAVDRESAEAELFGSAAAPSETRTAPIEERTFTKAKAEERTYTQEEIDHGVALNAAVVLDDPSRINQTIRAIEELSDREGLHLKAVTWLQASGMVGQFVTLSRIILYSAVFIIFAVALVIINNAMLMATLQRVKEIGTMRAIGAQGRFVLIMLLGESVVVGLLFGLIGAALGAGAVWLIRFAGGIAARSDALYFFFSGPSLLPALGTGTLWVSLVIVALVSVLSGLYPALVARRVTPLEAMNADD